MKYFITIFSIFILIKTPIWSQATMGSGEYIKENIYWTYSIGDLAIKTFEIPSYIWTQGSLQPALEIETPLIILQDVSYEVYPNPTLSSLVIHSSAVLGNKNVLIQLTDLSGKLQVTSKEFFGQNINIDMSHLTAGTYILTFIQNAKKSSTKIIKL